MNDKSSPKVSTAFAAVNLIAKDSCKSAAKPADVPYTVPNQQYSLSEDTQLFPSRNAFTEISEHNPHRDLKHMDDSTGIRTCLSFQSSLSPRLTNSFSDERNGNAIGKFRISNASSPIISRSSEPIFNRCENVPIRSNHTSTNGHPNFVGDNPRAALEAISLAYSSLVNGSGLTPSPTTLGTSCSSTHPSRRIPQTSFMPPLSNYLQEYMQSLTTNRSHSATKELSCSSQVPVHSILNVLFPEKMESWQQMQEHTSTPHTDPRILGLYGVNSYPFEIPGGGRRKNATRETTSMLKAWLNEHRKNPYPTKGEKIMLAIVTKMSLTQVSTWFANARRRLKKENKMTWTARSSNSFQDKDSNSNDDDEFGDDDEGQSMNEEPTDDAARLRGIPRAHTFDEIIHSNLARLKRSGVSEQTLSIQEGIGLFDSEKRSTKRSNPEQEQAVSSKHRKIWSVADLSSNATNSIMHSTSNTKHGQFSVDRSSPNKKQDRPVSFQCEAQHDVSPRDDPCNFPHESGVRMNRGQIFPSKQEEFLHGMNMAPLLSPAALTAFYFYYHQKHNSSFRHFPTEEFFNTNSESVVHLRTTLQQENHPNC